MPGPPAARPIEREMPRPRAGLVQLAREGAERAARRYAPSPARLLRVAAGSRPRRPPTRPRAIAAVLADLASGHPMDRLLCGDVGFGKTEVALRAAAAVGAGGGQVAVVAPTTVLVRQHLDTFRRRLPRLRIRIAALSRLTSRRRGAAGLARAWPTAASGVVIGTQAAGRQGRPLRRVSGWW